MKKIILFMLLLVNIQVVTKSGDLIFKSAMTASAQHMVQEPGDNCYDEVEGYWYHSDSTCDGIVYSFPCKFCNTCNPTEAHRLLHQAACPFRPDDDDDDDGTISFECPRCHQKFRTQDELSIHRCSTDTQTITLPTGGGGGGGGGSKTGGKSGGTSYSGKSSGNSKTQKDQSKETETEYYPIIIPDEVPHGSIGSSLADLTYKVGTMPDSELDKLFKDLGFNREHYLLKNLGIPDQMSNGLKLALVSTIDMTTGTKYYTLIFAGTEIEKNYWTAVPAGLSGLLAQLLSETDVKQDIYQVFGESAQYYYAAAIGVKLRHLLGDRYINFIGHSLGGGLATIASTLSDPSKGLYSSWGITYNPANLSPATMKKMGEYGYGINTEKLYNYVAEQDELRCVQNCFSALGLDYQGHVQNVTITNGSDYDLSFGHSIGKMTECLKKQGY